MRHGKPEFTRLVEVKDKQMIAGTQKIDGAWGNIKNWLRGKRGVPGKLVPLYMREAQWRYINGDNDRLMAFGSAMKQAREQNLIVC